MHPDAKPDQSFDAIADKFERNIYGSSKGKLRHELLLHYLNQTLDITQQRLNILDAGGGTGVMSADMLRLGHQVTLNDLSQDALTMAQTKLGSPEALTYQLGEIQALDSTTGYDLVLCHAVMEWLEDPWPVLDKLLSLTKPEGYLSISFFNRDAHLFGNLLYGNFDYVEKGLKQKNTVRLNPNNAIDPQEVLQRLATMPVTVRHEAGIRCIHDYLKNPAMQISHYEQLKAMELKYGQQAPFKWLGKYFHVIVQKHSS